MEAGDWGLIGELLQKLELVENGLASEAFKSQTLEKLDRSCDTE